MTDRQEHRWRYLEDPRPAATLDAVSLGQLGQMMDTLKDAVLIMRHIARDPKLEPEQDDHVNRFFSQTHVPAAAQRLASDVRESPTFTRPDLGRPNIAPEHPDLSAFLNHLHGLMRASSLTIGKSFVIPDSITAEVSAYDQAIEAYGVLLDAHRNPHTGQRDFSQVPESEMHAFGEQFEPLAERLCNALEALDSIEVEHEGIRHRIANHPSLNPQLPDCCAARMLFALRTLGRGAADTNKRPAQWEYHGRMGTVIGKQSMITDSTGALLERMQQAGFPAHTTDINRDKLSALLRRYTHSFQLAQAFLRTADCGYDMLHHDLELWTQFSGGTPGELAIASPADAALLLYAIERRIARDLPADQATDLRRTLRRQADKLMDTPSLEALSNNQTFALMLHRADALAKAQSWPQVHTAITQIQDAIPAPQQTHTTNR